MREQQKGSNSLKTEINVFIINWNSRWPIDYWWRKKYNVPFGSTLHRQTDFIKMYLDYEEERMMKKLFEKSSTEVSDPEFEEQLTKTGVGKKMTQKEIDDDFDNLDISSYNKIKDKETKNG